PAISLRRALHAPGLSLIAEIKRASPSKGRFPVEFEVDEVASSYRSSGANAISVLTDEPFFQGSLADLEATCRVAHEGAGSIPVLRKDFIIDEYQLLEARAHGADATLLIVGALTGDRLGELMRAADSIGIEVLVEVHDESEMDRALAAGANLIGINNRDLRTFVVDLGVSERLAAMVPEDVVLVGESGIFTAGDANRMRSAGMDAVLVGESLIVAQDRAAAVAQIKLDAPRGARV
ncbi:MAG: indole-3-glycerol phosphate synthase TrpC, partial [Thermomicrobiales bacterium]|nr:indole-3-glycerol phosphate synthase TrpC [Thermomicrobiales bacterium]